MKRYDLSKVMKGAHNMYRTGKYASFSAALKRSWKVVKFSAGIKACLPAVEAGIAEKERINAKRKAWVKQVEDERGKRCVHAWEPAFRIAPYIVASPPFSDRQICPQH